MAAERSAGATSQTVEGWHDIDWQAVQSNVRRLQARIVKATQEGRWGKVRALQRLLTHSFSGRALAVKRVTEHTGAPRPGVDGAIWDSPHTKAVAIHTLRHHGYRPQPFRQVSIPGGPSRQRPPGILTMKDRAMQVLYLLALDPIAETTGDCNSFGFRAGRSPADAIVQCARALMHTQAATWVLQGDLTSCFGRISQEWLLARICLEKPILRKWLKAGHLGYRRWYETEQGGISPVLANLVLDGLERRLTAAFPHHPRRGTHPAVTFIRYAGAFVITGCSRELLENDVKALVEEFLRERGLALSPQQTRIAPLAEGFDLLGYTLRTSGGRVFTGPSQGNVKAFLSTIRTIIKGHPTLPAAALIKKLNPVIRAWARTYRHAARSAMVRRVDRAIFEALWRWAKRRHPRKGARWLRQKYFCTVGTRAWTFYARADEQGTVTLFSTAAGPLKRQRTLRGGPRAIEPQTR